MMIRENIPADMAEAEQWLPRIGEKHAPTGWNEASNWKMLDDIPNGQEVIFNMNGTCYLIIDCDHVKPDGKFYQEAYEVIERIVKGRKTYAEYSQSGQGMHIIYDLTEYSDDFEAMTGKGRYNIRLNCAQDAHIEFYFKTAHLFRLTGIKTKYAANRVAGKEDAAEAARVVLKLIEEYNGKAEGVPHEWHKDGAGRVPVGERHHYVVSRIGEMVNRIGDHAGVDAILALIEADFRENCAEPDNVEDDFKKKYRKTIEKYLENHAAEKSDPNFYSYALKAWKFENPGETFDPEVTSWTEVKESGERAKASGWEPEARKTQATTKDGKVVPTKKVPELKFISAKELYSAKLPEIYYPIERLIPEGETILAAPPKSAKSWMALDMALCVAKGEKFLDFETHKADVLYCSLEDGDKFSQERLHKYCGSEDVVPENFHLIFEDWVPLDEGFMDQLEQARNAFPDLRLVIIDTLAKIQSKQKKGESAYERDYRTGQMLKSWADKHGIAVLVVTHTTKLIRPEDALANVSGTNGVTGVADAVIVIAKEKRTDTDAVLVIDGRRVRQAEHEIRINWDTCHWDYIGIADPDERERRQREREAEELRNSTAYKAVVKVAEMNPHGWEGGAKKLVNDAIKYGVLVTESPKEVGGMLTNKIVMFAQDGVRVQVMKNGTGANSYKLSAWQSPVEENVEVPFELNNLELDDTQSIKQ